MNNLRRERTKRRKAMETFPAPTVCCRSPASRERTKRRKAMETGAPRLRLRCATRGRERTKRRKAMETMSAEEHFSRAAKLSGTH